MDLALSIGDDWVCGRHFISVGVDSLDGLARSGDVGLSGAYIVGCNSSQARREGIAQRTQSFAMRNVYRFERAWLDFQHGIFTVS
jgi:hypothetical protein